MAIYRLDLEKVRANEYWTNSYLVNVASEAAAITAANDLVTREKLIHQSGVVFVHHRVRLTGQTALPGVKTAVSGVGAGAQPASNYYPLFCVLRIDFASTDRSISRKYYRLPITGNDAGDGLLNGPAFTAFQNWANATLVAVPSLCDPQGNALTNAAVSLSVGMRQLRRASKRSQPVV